jgi:hypothetical protein
MGYLLANENGGSGLLLLWAQKTPFPSVFHQVPSCKLAKAKLPTEIQPASVLNPGTIVTVDGNGRMHNQSLDVSPSEIRPAKPGMVNAIFQSANLIRLPPMPRKIVGSEQNVPHRQDQCQHPRSERSSGRRAGMFTRAASVHVRCRLGVPPGCVKKRTEKKAACCM